MKIIKKIGCIANGVIRRSHWYNEVMFPDCKKFWTQRTFNLDVVNLGSTSGLYAFNYDGLNIKAVNWALRQNPILADQEILNNYYSYLNPNGAVVIIPLCPFTSLSGSNEYFDDKFYTLVRMSSMPHPSIKRKMQILDIMNRPLKYYPIFDALYVSKKCLKDLFHHKRRLLSENEMEADSDVWYDNWLHEFSIQDFLDPLSLINQDAIIDSACIIDEMINFCKERNLRPVLIIPPMYHTLAEKFSPKAREIIISSLINRLESENLEFFNYLDASDFANDKSLFQNSFLLNEKGARKFTKVVLRDIKVIQSDK